MWFIYVQICISVSVYTYTSIGPLTYLPTYLYLFDKVFSGYQPPEKTLSSSLAAKAPRPIYLFIFFLYLFSELCCNDFATWYNMKLIQVAGK
jgi:hypothetical protein